MGIYQRAKTVVNSTISKILNDLQDPRKELDYSYEKQLDLLQNVKKGIAELTAAKKRLELHKQNLEKDFSKFDLQAKESLKQGNEGLARMVLERKNKTKEDIDSLAIQIDNLNKDQAKLVETQKMLELKIEELRTKKETIKAEYDAAKASAEIKESLSGIGNEVGNVGLAIERAKDKTENLKARSAAMDELTDSGVLQDGFGDKKDSVDRELEKVRTKQVVDGELGSMKREMRLKTLSIRLKNNDLNALVGLETKR